MNNGRYISDKCLTREVLAGTKTLIMPPKGANVVNIKCASSVTWYEAQDTYVEDGITYGVGYTGTNMDFPVVWNRPFWITNTVTATLLFSSIREV